MKTFSTLACIASLAFAPLLCAQAATVSYDFSVSGAAGAGNGSFQFNDAAGTPSGPLGETEYVLTAFSFSFGGAAFDLGDLDPVTRLALFDGTTLLGLEAFALGGEFSFLPSVAGADPFLVTARASSTVSYRLDDGVVPEPGSALLALAALSAAAALRRRRADQGAPMNK